MSFRHSALGTSCPQASTRSSRPGQRPCRISPFCPPIPSSHTPKPIPWRTQRPLAGKAHPDDNGALLLDPSTDATARIHAAVKACRRKSCFCYRFGYADLREQRQTQHQLLKFLVDLGTDRSNPRVAAWCGTHVYDCEARLRQATDQWPPAAELSTPADWSTPDGRDCSVVCPTLPSCVAPTCQSQNCSSCKPGGLDTSSV